MCDIWHWLASIYHMKRILKKTSDGWPTLVNTGRELREAVLNDETRRAADRYLIETAKTVDGVVSR